MKKFFSSRVIQASIIGGSFLIVATIIGILNSKPATTTYAPQTMGHSNGVQIQGNGNNINQEATYTWQNENSWSAVPGSCTIETSTSTTACDYIVDTEFLASTPTPPISGCLNVSADVPLEGIEMLPSGDGVKFHVPPLKYSYCNPGSTIGTNPTFRIWFYKKPTNLSASLVKDTK